MNSSGDFTAVFLKGLSATGLAAAASIVLLGGCGGEEKEQEPLVTVSTRTVRRATVSQTVTAEAVVFPVQQAVIFPKITSTVKEFKVQRGSRIRKGQLLALLENRELSAAAVSSKGDLEQAEAAYVTTVNASLPQQIQKAELDAAAAKAGFDAQLKVYESRKELFGQGALPRRDLDAGEVALAQARSTNEQAQRQLADLQRLGKEQALKAAVGTRQSAQGRYQGAQAQLSYSEIRSPLDGVVTDRPLYVGDLATTSQPIMTVMDTSRLIAKAHIAADQAATLKVGNPAEIRVEGLDLPIKGKVTLVSPALDPGSTTIEVWAEAVKQVAGWRAGMTVELEITSKSVKDALAVPTAAIYKTAEGGEIVLVAGSDGLAHWKTVEVGTRGEELSQILKGVSEGEAVISSGGYALPDKTKIKLEPAGGEKTESGEKPDKAAGSPKPDVKEKE